ncbi:MAG: glycogen debranching protein GlgX [Bryobacteraceae bacterium]
MWHVHEGSASGGPSGNVPLRKLDPTPHPIRKGYFEPPKVAVMSRRFLSAITPDFEISRGAPAPLGATLERGGINFAVFSRHATSVHLVLFLPGHPEPVAEFPLDPVHHRTGNIWHALVRGLDPGIEYAYRMTREPNRTPHLHRFDQHALLQDPYAKAFSEVGAWGEHSVTPRRSRIVDGQFDWEYDQPLNIPLTDSIIYELHVRGYTRHASSAIAHPGTYRGLIEKIPYLQKLGITAVELMPVQEFDETDLGRHHPSGSRLLNFWGYSTFGFFAPKAAYSTDSDPDAVLREFKEMVKQFHRAGIEVILDVVFNHTAEGDQAGPTLSFRGLDNFTYYIVDPENGGYHNYSGCGNTMNCNHPVVRNFVLDCLRYWVTEMHVDGFRFDLAAVLGRGRDGSVLANPPLIEQIAADPVLADTKLIAEAWDAAGLYQVGSFPAWERWAEWNGQFRDDIRRFVRGDAGMAGRIAARLCGSPDLYHSSSRRPYHSINFVTCHDGFTLADLVSYNQKHNLANGEHNRDGCDENWSWNCGHEGPSGDPAVLRLRKKQVKDLATLLLFSAGVPMMLAGDELGRTQQGNNNAYCQDNEVTWLNWDLEHFNGDLLRFFRFLIRFRKSDPLMRLRNQADWQKVRITWHGVKPGEPDWSAQSRSLAMQVSGADGAGGFYLISNAFWEPLTFELPPVPGGMWTRFIDSSLESPHDIVDLSASTPVTVGATYRVEARSTVVLLPVVNAPSSDNHR